MEFDENTALEALRLIFRPIARILLRAGVSWRELVEVFKATYVEIATEDFGIRGRPTNTSRVSILTGFTRREVRRLRQLLAEETRESFDRMNHATRLLSGWFQDDEYIGEDGAPAALAFTGGNPSFESLCTHYSPDVPATTMLKELKHVGAVTENEDGTLVAKKRYYMPVLMDPEQMLRSGKVMQDVGETVAYNLHRTTSDPSRFERRATSTRIPAKAVPDFRKFIENEGLLFLERVDTWLTEHEEAADSDIESIRLGLGTYWIQENFPERVET